MKTYAIALTVILTLCTGMVPAVDLFVDPVNGDDSRSGDSWETAIKTITEASRRHDIHEIQLAHGLYNADSGEMFPISFRQIPGLISGRSPETTVIDAGTGSTILSSRRDSNRDCIIADVCFRSLGDTAFANAEGPMLVLRCDEIAFEWTRFEEYGSLTEPVLASPYTSSYFPPWEAVSFSDCTFADCQAQLLPVNWEEFTCYSLYIRGCTFVRSSLSFGSDSFPPRVSLDGWLEGCRFEGPGSFLGFDVSSALTYINCAFEDQRFQVFPGDPIYHAGRVYWPTREVIGCSFKNSTVQTVAYGGGADFAYCAFDPVSKLIVVDGWASVYASCSSFIDDPDDGLSVYGLDARPMFVDGPLGGCYLSNAESGQAFSSPCLSGISERYRGWPPGGSTTRTDGIPDEWPYDIGYHYPSVPPPPPAAEVRTDRAEYAVADEMQAFMSYENRGVKVEGAVYFAFAPESLDWLIYWPWMTFVPMPWAEGTLYSGVSYRNLPPTTHTIPEGLAPGGYFWLGAVISADGAFASDIAFCPVTITMDS